MFRTRLFIYFLFTSLVVKGQDLTMSQVLRTALNTAGVSGFEKQVDWLNKGDFDLPWINTLEFRTRNNELLYNRQQYAVRLDIENPLKVIQNRRYFETQQQLSALRRQRVIKEGLVNRYLALIRLIEARDVLAIRRLEDSLAHKLLDGYKEKIGLAGLKATDVVEAQLDIVSRQADLREAEFECSVLQSRVARLSGAPGSVVQDLNSHILPEQIALIYDSVKQGVNLIEVMEKAKEVELASRKVSIDKFSYAMGWVQGMYVPYKRDGGERPTGIALGLTIPLFNKNNDDEARNRLDVLEEEAALQQLKTETQDHWIERKESLRLLLSHYRRVQEQLTALQSDGFNWLDTLNNYDPVPRIRLELKLLKFKLLLSRISNSILSEWILLLDETDVIGQLPLQNYLTGKLERID